jgi:hypothetical protein
MQEAQHGREVKMTMLTFHLVVPKTNPGPDESRFNYNPFTISRDEIDSVEPVWHGGSNLCLKDGRILHVDESWARAYSFFTGKSMEEIEKALLDEEI